jgi:hypothetical protein
VEYLTFHMMFSSYEKQSRKIGFLFDGEPQSFMDLNKQVFTARFKDLRGKQGKL